jgi:transcriptional regulator with XRE-family HTH domain
MSRKAATMILNEIPASSHANDLSDTQPVTSMPLDALRDARQLTQVQMAQLLKISQGAVSKVERRTDMFVSTLRNYVRAIGGDLEIRAVFPEGNVLIDQFTDVRRSEPGTQPRAASRRYERKHVADA